MMGAYHTSTRVVLSLYFNVDLMVKDNVALRYVTVNRTISDGEKLGSRDGYRDYRSDGERYDRVMLSL